jgi:hypothetical protein
VKRAAGQEHVMDENGFWKIVEDANDSSGGGRELEAGS